MDGNKTEKQEYLLSVEIRKNKDLETFCNFYKKRCFITFFVYFKHAIPNMLVTIHKTELSDYLFNIFSFSQQFSAICCLLCCEEQKDVIWYEDSWDLFSVYGQAGHLSEEVFSWSFSPQNLKPIKILTLYINAV